MSNNTDESSIARLIGAAQLGSNSALAEILERVRPQLIGLANAEIPLELKAKLGGSDLVQDTLFEAARDFANFRGTSEQELLGWLRRILKNNAANVIRHFRETAKRNVGLEVTLDARHGAKIADMQGDDPSSSAHARQREQLEALEQVLESLPENYRDVIRFRSLERRSYAEIGQLMGCSMEAARKLWTRAVAKLQETLDTNHEQWF